MFVSQARLDQYRRQMEQDVSEMVNRVRGEGVDRIIKLKKTYGCTTDNDGLTLTQVKVEQRVWTGNQTLIKPSMIILIKIVLCVLLERRSP